MKNKQNGFYKTNSKGISLIVLVITIIVIIILATAILVSVISNNPISEANKARYESDRDNMQAVFTNTVGKIMAENQGTVNITAGQINTVTKDAKEATGTVAYTVDNATVAENASGTIVFDKDANTATTYYTGKKLPIYAAGETKWYVDSEGVISLEVAGVKYGSGEIEEAGTEPSAAAVAAAPTTYYGYPVTNYETGDATIDAQVDWQIFHSDGNNIYLIATDYIHYDICPASANNTIYKNSDYCLSMNNVKNDYNGSADITDTALVGLNSKYHAYLTEKGETSTYTNMKAVAYMMDTRETVWGKFAGVDAAYAIGGPTLELFIDSYNNKKGTNYGYNVDSTTGYKVTTDTTAETVTWDYSFGGLDTSDTQYVLPGKSNGGKANAMWLASPSVIGDNYVVYVDFNGGVYGNLFNGGTPGFRPLVCLNSDVSLEATENGFVIQ